MDIKKEYERWLANATADADVVVELKTLDDAKIEDAFYRDKTTPRLIQFHTFKNAVNPPFLGGFSVFGTAAA